MFAAFFIKNKFAYSKYLVYLPKYNIMVEMIIYNNLSPVLFCRSTR